MSNLLNLVLLGATLFTGAAFAQSTRFDFALRGNITKNGPVPNEIIDIYYVANGRKTLSRSNVQLTKSWSNFTITVPANQVAEGVQITLKNDRVGTTAQGVPYDTNVILDMNNFSINGARVANLSRWIGGPMLEQLYKSDDYMRMGWLLSGNFKWNGHYNISMPFYLPSAAACGSPNAKNLVCMDLRGNIGNIVPGNAEKIKVSYLTHSNKRYTVIDNYPMNEWPERFAIQGPSNDRVKQVIVTLLNDRVWEIDGNRTDRNVYMNVTNVQINSTTVPLMSPYIQGPVYDNFIRIKDYHRAGLISGGVFAWNQDYTIDIPTFEELASTMDPCVQANQNLPVSNLNSICFQLKGYAAASNPSDAEIVEISYQDSKNRTTILEPSWPLSNVWNTFKYSINAPDRVVSLMVNFLNSNMSSKSAVDFNLMSVSVNGQRFTDETPCFDAVPIKKDRLKINII